MGFRDGLTIGVGYLVISFAMGLFASSLGLNWFEALAISMLNLTSAGQVTAMPIIAVGGSLLEIGLTQLVINSRYALMSISLSQRLGKSVRVRDRFLIGFFNTDEIFALACGKDSLLGKRYLFALVLYPYIGWSLGTLLGSLLGSVLPAMVTSAFSVSLYAMFIAIITPAAKVSRSTTMCIFAAIALSITFELAPLLSELPKGMVVVIVTLLLSTVFALIAPISEHDPWEDEEVEHE